MTQKSSILPAFDLGWLVVCLPAADFPLAIDFYKRVGFEPVGGQPENGWVIMGGEGCELNPMQGLPSVWLNFRGADISALSKELRGRGFVLRDHNVFEPAKWPAALWRDEHGIPLPHEDSGDFFIDDPDGNVIYFDTVPIERPRFAAGEPHSAPGFDGERREGQPRLGQLEVVLWVTDLNRSRQFYELLGLKVTEDSGNTLLLASQARLATRLRLRQAEQPGVVLRFVGTDPGLAKSFKAAGLSPEEYPGKLVLISPDGLRLKFLFSD